MYRPCRHGWYYCNLWTRGLRPDFWITAIPDASLPRICAARRRLIGRSSRSVCRVCHWYRWRRWCPWHSSTTSIICWNGFDSHLCRSLGSLRTDRCFNSQYSRLPAPSVLEIRPARNSPTSLPSKFLQNNLTTSKMFKLTIEKPIFLKAIQTIVPFYLFIFVCSAPTPPFSIQEVR